MQELTQASLLGSINNRKMGFVKNVNYIQRDQYCSQRTLVYIQGDKKNGVQGSVLPRFKIPHCEIQMPGAVWMLCVYIGIVVQDVGKKIIYYNPIRGFSLDDSKKLYDHCEIPIVGDDWTSDKGAELRLKVVTIKEAKVYSNTLSRVLCELKDNEQYTMSTLSTDNNESCHLVIILQKDGVLQEETLVLSDPMIFPDRPGKSKKTRASNNQIIMIPVVSGQSKSKKRQSGKNKRQISTKKLKTSNALGEQYPSTENNGVSPYNEQNPTLYPISVPNQPVPSTFEMLPVNSMPFTDDSIDQAALLSLDLSLFSDDFHNPNASNVSMLIQDPNSSLSDIDSGTQSLPLSGLVQPASSDWIRDYLTSLSPTNLNENNGEKQISNYLTHGNFTLSGCDKKFPTNNANGDLLDNDSEFGDFWNL